MKRWMLLSVVVGCLAMGALLVLPASIPGMAVSQSEAADVMGSDCWQATTGTYTICNGSAGGCGTDDLANLERDSGGQTRYIQQVYCDDAHTCKDTVYALSAHRCAGS